MYRAVIFFFIRTAQSLEKNPHEWILAFVNWTNYVICKLKISDEWIFEEIKETELCPQKKKRVSIVTSWVRLFMVGYDFHFIFFVSFGFHYTWFHVFSAFALSLFNRIHLLLLISLSRVLGRSPACYQSPYTFYEMYSSCVQDCFMQWHSPRATQSCEMLQNEFKCCFNADNCN